MSNDRLRNVIIKIELPPDLPDEEIGYHIGRLGRILAQGGGRARIISWGISETIIRAEEEGSSHA